MKFKKKDIGRISRFLGPLMVLLTCTQSLVAAGTRAVLTVANFSPYAYACEISDYGNSLTMDFVYRAILMMPPEDPMLCTMPEVVLRDESNMTLPTTPLQMPIGLMVSLGVCDVHTKIQVALRLRSKLRSSALNYIVFYNNDPDKNDEIFSISPPAPDSGFSIPEDIDRVSLLSVSTSAGVNLVGLIRKYSEFINTSSQLLTEGSEAWNLGMVVQHTPNPYNPPNNVNEDKYLRMREEFQWFQIIMFALLITSPCCRGAYLWWTAGGRIYFRRNENGRIVGLQYIPPVAFWLGSHAIPPIHVPVVGCLTVEQVMALPEIVYRPKSSDSPEQESGTIVTTSNSVEDDLEIVVSSGSAESLPQSPDERVPSIGQPLRGSDEEQSLEDNFETPFTTCSICIDEFEVGERLRLLPRCKHVFHTECILPWLTERQGSCPLCKTPVIHQEEGGNEGQVQDSSGDGGLVGEVESRSVVSTVPTSSGISVSITGPVSSSLSSISENIPGEEGPPTTNCSQDQVVLLSMPDQESSIPSHTELPCPIMEPGDDEEMESRIDSPTSTETIQAEVSLAIETLLDTATDEAELPSTSEVQTTGSH